MSLKQECIDMINLIIKPLQDDANDYYMLEEDAYVDICGKTGLDITYTSCKDFCDNYNKNYKCRHENVKVDISFYCVDADCTYNYVFGNNKAIGCKGVCTIKNRKQLMKEMSALKKELETDKDLNADFGKNYGEYLKYAKRFAEEVKEKYIILRQVQTEILPIIFHIDYAHCNGKAKYSTAGNLVTKGKQNVINIFWCMRNEEEIKSTIRHEVLHYLLYIAGLKYQDDTAIFHYLCNEYDAGAYKEMNDEEQKLYAQLSNGVEMLRLNRQIKLEDESTIIEYMFFAVGTNEDDPTYGTLCKEGRKILKMFELEKEVAI